MEILGFVEEMVCDIESDDDAHTSWLEHFEAEDMRTQRVVFDSHTHLEHSLFKVPYKVSVVLSVPEQKLTLSTV